MRRITVALLCATYVCLSLIVSLTIWRNGGGWGAGLAALVGGLGLCLSLHGLIARALRGGDLRGEIEAVRDAHRILLDQMVPTTASTSTCSRSSACPSAAPSSTKASRACATTPAA
jgi:cyclic-di-GMP phosphodiesterase TipF (flagellum assembly factor)